MIRKQILHVATNVENGNATYSNREAKEDESQYKGPRYSSFVWREYSSSEKQLSTLIFQYNARAFYSSEERTCYFANICSPIKFLKIQLPTCKPFLVIFMVVMSEQELNISYPTIFKMNSCQVTDDLKLRVCVFDWNK